MLSVQLYLFWTQIITLIVEANWGFCASQGPQILVTDSNMKTEVEQAFNKNTQLQQLLDKAKRELQENQDQWVFMCFIRRGKCAFPTENITLWSLNYICLMFTSSLQNGAAAYG